MNMRKLPTILCGLFIIFGVEAAMGQANQTLSNLSAPTSINASLLFGADNTYAVGSSADAVSNIYTYQIEGSPNSTELSVTTPGVSSGNAPSVSIGPGNSSASGGFGGSISLTAGSGTGSSGRGAGISLNSGSGSGGGGTILLNSAWDIQMYTDSYNGVAMYLHKTGPIELAAPVTQLDGHIAFDNGAGVTITSCGTGASYAGNDSVGRITVGSGTSSCAITFSQTWDNAPICTVSNETAIIAMQVVPTTTTLTISANANFAASTVLDYHCVEYN